MLQVYFNCLEPETSIYKWLFQLDDEPNFYRKWLEIAKHPFKELVGFRVPGLFISGDRGPPCNHPSRRFLDKLEIHGSFDHVPPW